jgi:hypothetical protein
MAETPIVLFDEVDISKLTVGNVRTLENLSKSVNVSYAGKPFYLQTPAMFTAPYGLSKWPREADDSDPTVKYSLDLTFKGLEERKSLQKFHKTLQDLDDFFINVGLDNSQAFFKKKLGSRDVVAAGYSPLLRIPVDSNGEPTRYPPSMNIKLPTKNGRFTCDVFDANEKVVPDLRALNLNSAKATAILQCTAIWIAGNRFGVSFRVSSLQVTPTAVLSGFCFRKTVDDSPKVLPDAKGNGGGGGDDGDDDEVLADDEVLVVEDDDEDETMAGHGGGSDDDNGGGDEEMGEAAIAAAPPSAPAPTPSTPSSSKPPVARRRAAGTSTSTAAARK